MLCLVSQPCLTLCDPMDCSLLGSSVHGDSPGKNLEWVAMYSPRESSQPRDCTQVSHISGKLFTNWTTREAQKYWSGYSFSRSRNWTRVSWIAGRLFTSWATREALVLTQWCRIDIFVSGYYTVIWLWLSTFYLLSVSLLTKGSL